VLSWARVVFGGVVGALGVFSRSDVAFEANVRRYALRYSCSIVRRCYFGAGVSCYFSATATPARSGTAWPDCRTSPKNSAHREIMPVVAPCLAWRLSRLS